MGGSPRTIAVYGGGFNPPHVGHALVTAWILKSGKADTVLLVPSASHPFGKQMAPFEKRVSLSCALAEDVDPEPGENPRVLVSEVEATLPAPNYTLHQLRKLREMLGPTANLRCVMGTDNLALRSKWYGFDDILVEFDPIFVNREGVEGVEDIQSPMFPNISSTEVRRRLHAGEVVDHLLTPTVRRLVLGENILLR